MKYVLGDEDLTQYVDPVTSEEADVRDAFTEQIDWSTSGEYDGWERAGAEAFMRKGYQDGEPVMIQKTGNAYKMITRGTLLDHGANMVPTLMFVDDEADRSDGVISGGDYTIIQKYVPEEPTASQLPSHAEANNFRDRYQHTEDVSEQAIEQFAQNCAAIDLFGFNNSNPDNVPGQFLTDGDQCYMVDVGADLGATPAVHRNHDYDPQELNDTEWKLSYRTDMHEAGEAFLDEEHQGVFEETYGQHQEDMLSTYMPRTHAQELLNEIGDLSAWDKRYLQKSMESAQ